MKLAVPRWTRRGHAGCGVEPFPDELQRQRRYAQDLALLSTLPGAWAGYDGRRIVDGLADVLLRTLNLEFVYVRVPGVADAASMEVPGAADAAPLEVVRTSDPPTGPDPARVLAQALAPWIEGDEHHHPTSIPHPLDGGTVQLAVIPLECGGVIGAVVAGSREPDFPSAADHLVASAICNQAAVLLHLRRAEELARHRETRWQALIDKERHECAALLQQLLVLYASALGHLCSLKRTEEARRESDARFRQVMENIRQVCWMISIDQEEMLYVSPVYEEIWGRTCASLYAAPSSWLESVHPEERERVRASVLRGRPLGRVNEEYRIVRPDGTIRWIWAQGFPVLDEAGRPYRMAGIAEDITERKQTEELKTTLLSAVSHDLQAPLVSLITSIAHLRRQREVDGWSNDGREALAGLEEEGWRLHALMRNLLDLSYLESGQWQPAWEMHDLAELLGSVLGRLPAAAAARVRVSLPATLPAVRVDGVRIAQVLWNLLDNALKYSPPEVPVEVRAATKGEQLWVAVRDEGPGVAPLEQTRIFERYYRSSAAPGSAGAGLGLGLAICRELVEAHGGRIWVESEGAGGATLVFTLPLLTSPEVRP